jgi:Immunoglobulin domain
LQFVRALKVLPQIIPFSFGEEEVNFDEAVTATCTITKGDQPIKIWWSLSDSDLGMDRNLSSSDGVMITRNSQKISMLAIEAVKARHRGNYTCYAMNKAGLALHSAFLAVNG